MSASSLCVTWGTLSQERCRKGPETFLIRGRGAVSMGPNVEKSCTGISGIPAPVAVAAAGWAGPLRNPSRSSLVMRPLGPVGVTAARSTPNSRAVRRTEGPACIPAGVSTPPAAGAAAGAEGAGAGAAAGVEAGAGSCCSTSDGGVLTAPSPGVSSRMGLPSLTTSPTLTRTSATEPAAGAGMSMVALSDSRVTSGSSALTWSPALTCTSMIGTAPKSPMSGILTSVGAVMSIVSFLIGSERSGERGCGLVGIDVVAGDGVRCGRGRNGALGGQLGQRGQRDVVPVDLEVPAQVAPVVRAPEPVGAEHPVPAVQARPDLVSEGPHVVGRGDHRAGWAPGQALLGEAEPPLLARMQHVPAVDVDAVASQLGEAGHAPHVGGHAEVLFQQLGGRDHLAQDGAGAQ